MATRFGLIPPDPVPKMYEDDESTRVDGSQYLLFFKSKLQNLIFRRVARVFTQREDYLGIIYYAHDGIREIENYETLSTQEYEQNIEYHYSKFSFSTTRSRLRDNDDYMGEITGSSHEFAYLNTDSWNFEYTRTTVPPRQGDLICGIIDTRTTNKARYFSWFICSEQFYRTWTILMYGTSNLKYIEFKFSDNYDLKKKLFSGNRLCTSNYKKFLIRCKNTGIEPTEEERTKRFYRLRTEPMSQEYIHFYAALVLMLYYNEAPNINNIPKNLDLYPSGNLAHWDLPNGWLLTLTATFVRLSNERVKVTKLERKTRQKRTTTPLECTFTTNDFPPLILERN